MEFEGQYLTYEEYKGLGGTLDLMPFNLLEFESRRKIDLRTYNRLKNVNSNEIPQEVKMCEFNLINSINGYNKSIASASASNVASVNTDGYSESYITPAQIEEIVKSRSSEINDIIREALGGVIFNGEHLLFCGVKNACKW